MRACVRLFVRGLCVCFVGWCVWPELLGGSQRAARLSTVGLQRMVAALTQWSRDGTIDGRADGRVGGADSATKAVTLNPFSFC